MAFKKKMPPEQRDALDAMLAEARSSARTEERDGRVFTVIRIPDRYGAAGPTGGQMLREERLVDTLGLGE